MPQYHMEGKLEPSYQALDAFTQAYIESIFWTENAPGVTTEEWQATEEHPEGSIPGDVGFTDLAPQALARIVEECQAFQHDNAADLSAAYAMERKGYGAAMGYDESNAGHDFWLTRNHHGAGFWDRNLGEVGDDLTTASHKFADTYLYLGDDGKVYLG